jgi:uncharacterized membrane protein
VKTRLRSFNDALQASYWFIPSLMVVALCGLSVVTQELDDRYGLDVAANLPGIFIGEPEGARAMLSTIAGSMITAAAVTFSITIAALANASSQFGPRLLRIFMRDTGSQIVLGTFLGTFIYCLLVLRQVHGTSSSISVPHISTTMAMLLALASIGVLIYFIHHIATLVQVGNVAARVGAELHESIGRLFPELIGQSALDDATRAAVPVDQPAGDVLPDANHRAVYAESIGYIQAIDQDSLMALADEYDIVIRLAMRPGEFVIPGGQLATVWPAERVTEAVKDGLQSVFLVGLRRTPFQDIELYFDELIEIALRALSLGINDPFTAHICIDWLAAGLAQLALRRPVSRYRFDPGGRLRIIADGPSVVHIIDEMFDEIRNAGSNYPSVLRKLLEAATVIAPNLPLREEREALLRQIMAIDVLARASTFAEHERRNLAECYLDAIEVLNEKHESG